MAPMSRRLPADGAARVCTASSEGRVESPRASSSLGPSETPALNASVPGTGLACWLAGGGVREPRERPIGDPAGGGASQVLLLGCATPGVGAERGAKGSDPGGKEPWPEPGWEPVRDCLGEKWPPAEDGSVGATRGGPKPGAAASADRAEPGAGAVAWRSARDMEIAGGAGATVPRPAADCEADGARGKPAAGLMTVTAPMT